METTAAAAAVAAAVAATEKEPVAESTTTEPVAKSVTTTTTTTTEPVSQADAREGEEEEPFVAAEGRVPYDILQMTDQYGPNHRGAVAGVLIEMGSLIHMEKALVYIVLPRYDDKDKVTFYAADHFHRLPLPLEALPDGEAVALACLLITTNPQKARLLADPSKGLHGRVMLNGQGTRPIDTAFDYFASTYPHLAVLEDKDPSSEKDEADKPDTEKWTKAQFTRLFAVMSLNAIRGYVPMSSIGFGVGIYPATALINHSCTPNAVAVHLPGKIALHALTDIKPGEEITIAYAECPRDYLAEDLVNILHYQMGVVSTERGSCRCAACMQLKAASALGSASGIMASGTPAIETQVQEEEVRVNLEHFLTERTRERLACDPELRSMFLIMFRDPLSHAAKKAAFVFYDKFSSLVCAPTTDAMGHPLDQDAITAADQEVLLDLAYILGDLYCTTTIHLPDQHPGVPIFWAEAYLAALTKSSINMPLKLETAIVARVHAFLYHAGTLPETDEEGRKKGVARAIEAWIVYKVFVFFALLPLSSSSSVLKMGVGKKGFARVSVRSLNLHGARVQGVSASRSAGH